MKNRQQVMPGMPINLGKYGPGDEETLIDGINLSKPEFEKVAKIHTKMFNKFGERYSTKEELVDVFKSEMRQKFSANVKFEFAGMRNEKETSNIDLLCARFQKDRPLIFLIIDKESNAWGLIDEKRFPPLDDKSPFLPVNI